MSKVTKQEHHARLQRNEEKWSPQLTAAGWTVIPSVILERQRALGLDTVDVNILLHLARYWWQKDNPPHPSKAAIAECIQMDPRTVQRHIARLEKDGLIKRRRRFSPTSGRQQTNFYLFDGLIKLAMPFAEELVATKEQRAKEDDERRMRKKPRKPALTLVGAKPASRDDPQ